MKYDVDYFIETLETIPENKWCTHEQENDKGQYCAYGQFNFNLCDHEAYQAFDKLSNDSEDYFNAGEYIGLNKENGYFPEINNGNYSRYQQPTPKQRILAALYDIKLSEINIDELRPLLTNHKNLELV